MSGLAARLLALFVDPADASIVNRGGAPVVSRRVGVAVQPELAVVLGPEPDVVAAASAIGLALAGRQRRACSVVAIWGPSQAPASGWALPATRRLVRALEAGGHEAGARGRLVFVSLPADPRGAAAAIERISALLDVPLCVALGAPRDGALDPLMRCADHVVLALGAAIGELVGEIAQRELGEVCAVPVTRYERGAAGPFARFGARSGIGRSLHGRVLRAATA